jgi:hypothetical protein
MERMCTELSPYMNSFEVDKIVEFMCTISGSKWDINPSIEDSKTQLQLILGKERYQEIVMSWTMKNQKLLTSFGTRKYLHKVDKTIWDGLDPEDKTEDYEQIFV